MLDIYTCIISCMVFSNLVPDIYFHGADTWDSCDMHYIDYMMFLDLPCYLSCDLMFLWFCDYTTQQLLVQDISCSLYICYIMHARLLVHNMSSRFSCYCYYYQFSIILIILFLLFQYPTCTVTVFSYSLFYCSFPSYTLAGPLLTNLYYFYY